MLLLDARNSRREDTVPLLGSKVRGITSLTMGLTGEVYGGFSVTDTLKYQFGSSALQILSWTSCLSIVPGILSAREGWKKAHLYGRINDLKGEVLGWLQFFRGAIRTGASSFCLIPASGLSLALFFTTSKTAEIALDVLKGSGGALLAGASFLLALSALIFMAHGLSVRYEMYQIGSDREALEMLRKKSESDLLYAFGAAGLEAVRLGSSFNATEVMETVRGENTKQLLISLLYLDLSICSAVLTFASLFIVSAPMLLEMAIMDTCLGFIWLVVDSVAFLDSIKDEKPGQYDKAWLRFTFLFCSLIILAATLLSNGTIPLIISCGLGLLLLLIHLTYFATPQDNHNVEMKPLLLTA